MKKSLLLMIGFLWCVLPFSHAHAALQVSGIKVDIESESGLKARELAIADARRKAFVELTQNNSAFFYDLKAKGMPTDEALEAAVDTFEIESEKISAKQYIGTLSISFSDHGLRRILRGHFVPEEKKETSSEKTGDKDIDGKNVILLPLYLTVDESQLWQSGNPWHSYWQTSPQEDVFKTLVPLGDVQDIMGTSIEDIMTGHYQRVQTLLDRYEKEALVVAILKRTSQEHNELELTVKLFHKERLVFSSDPLFIEGATLDEGFANARIELIKTLQNQGAAVKDTQDAGLQTYHVTATFSSFAQWQQIRRGLKTGAIHHFDISSLSRTYGKVTIQSHLAFNILASELARKGLVLSEGIPGSFNLQVGFTQKKSAPQLKSDFQISPEKRAVEKNAFTPKIRNAFETSS